MRIILTVLVLTTGCSGVIRTDVPVTRALTPGEGTRVLVVDDPIEKVTCWISWSGISCLPKAGR
jgi:hypothetical protein